MSKDPKRVKAGKMSKRKGSSQELKIAKLFAKWWGGQWSRTPGSGGWARASNREEFKASGDIVTAEEDWPYCVEVKNQECWNLDQLLLNEGCQVHVFWEQAVDETPDNLRPMLIIKKNRQQEIVMLYSTDPALSFITCRKFETTDRTGGLVTVFPLKALLALDPALLGRKVAPDGD